MSKVVKYWWRGKPYYGAVKPGCGRVFTISPQKINCDKPPQKADDVLKLDVNLDSVKRCCKQCD